MNNRTGGGNFMLPFPAFFHRCWYWLFQLLLGGKQHSSRAAMSAAAKLNQSRLDVSVWSLENATCRSRGMCGHWGVRSEQACASASKVKMSYRTNALLPRRQSRFAEQTHADYFCILAKLKGASHQLVSKSLICGNNPEADFRNSRKMSAVSSHSSTLRFPYHAAIRLHYGIWPLLWGMDEPCVDLGLSLFVCVCVHLLITCCYQRLATRPRVCIFPADWPQSASPPPALWLAAQTGAPANRNTNKYGRLMLFYW